jgi:hypothetical protein
MRGTYLFVYVPSDPTEDPVRTMGPWRFKDGTMEIKFDRKWISVRTKKDDAGRLVKLKIERDKPQGVYTRLRAQAVEW